LIHNKDVTNTIFAKKHITPEVTPIDTAIFSGLLTTVTFTIVVTVTFGDPVPYLGLTGCKGISCCGSNTFGEVFEDNGCYNSGCVLF
jgi:hypothetical protein